MLHCLQRKIYKVKALSCTDDRVKCMDEQANSTVIKLPNKKFLFHIVFKNLIV